MRRFLPAILKRLSEITGSVSVNGMLLAFGFLLSVLNFSSAQDIPLFSQKLTNSFMYNPALAGHTFGSTTFSYKQNYAKVEGAPKNYFLSLHAPFANHRFGIGGNIFQEEITFLRTTYASTAFAYHLRFNRFTVLSFGVSGEYNSIGLNGTTSGTAEDPEYQALIDGGIKKYDFSFGTHYQNRFLKAGVAMNRLASTWIDKNSTISNYFSSFVQGLIPLRGGEDLLEPYIAYRKLSDVNEIIDAGLFYTYNNRITIGASYRSGGIVSATLALRLSKYLMVGYSRETFTGNIGGFVGGANEYTIRYDFNDESYKERFRSDYKSAVAYRRKTISGPIGKSGAKSPKQMHRKQKRIAPYSPNARYQNMKKLGVKTQSKGKPKYKAKKRPKNFKKRRR
jgi:type IX secretion system PorP/SprF family membrane protein